MVQSYLQPVTPNGPRPVAMNPGKQPHLLSCVDLAFSGQAWQLPALRVTLTALSPQDTQVLCMLLALAAPAA